MHIPRILPDEIIMGYVGRIRILNNFQDSQQTTRALLNRYKPVNENNGDFCKFTAIANAASISEESLVLQHTLAPFVRALPYNNGIPPEKPYVSKFQITAPDRSLLRITRERARFCPHCTSEDLSFWGFPYWRRFHQVVGIEWCTKHKKALVSVNSKNAYDFLPDVENYSSGTEALEYENEYQKCPALHRYAEIAFGLTNLTQPINAQGAKKVLYDQAKKLGLRISESGKKPLMSDLATDAFPQGWLLRNFHEFSKKKKLKLLLNIDMVCSPGSCYLIQTRKYALAASLLYEDPNSALHALITAEPPKKNSDGKISALIKETGREKQIESAYIKSNGNHWKTSKVLEAEAKNLRAVLDSHGLPNLKNVSSETRQSLMAFLNGAPISQISIVDKEQFFNFLRLAGSPLLRALNLMEQPLPLSKKH